MSDQFTLDSIFNIGASENKAKPKVAKKEAKKHSGKVQNKREVKTAKKVMIQLPVTIFYATQQEVFTSDDFLESELELQKKAILAEGEQNQEDDTIDDEDIDDNVDDDSSTEDGNKVIQLPGAVTEAAELSNEPEQEQALIYEVAFDTLLMKFALRYNYAHLTSETVRHKYDAKANTLGIAFMAGSKGANAYIKVSEVDLGPERATCNLELTMGRIPTAVFSEFFEIARFLAEKEKEVMGLIYYDNETKNYFLHFPSQHTDDRPDRVHYTISDKYDDFSRYTLIGDIHSHHIFDVSFSPIDDLEDCSPMLHFLCYGYNCETRTFKHDVRYFDPERQLFLYPKDISFAESSMVKLWTI